MAIVRPKRGPASTKIAMDWDSNSSSFFCSIFLRPSFSFAGGLTLKAVMAQFQRMDAHLDTLTTEMY